MSDPDVHTWTSEYPVVEMEDMTYYAHIFVGASIGIEVKHIFDSILLYI